jgi:hypothetical protein
VWWFQIHWDNRCDLVYHHKSVSFSFTFVLFLECAVLFRYFRVRAVIVDFPAELVPSSSESACIGDRLFTWLKKYFTTTNDSPTDQSESFRSCLYFQHDGHSQSIVGVKWTAKDDISSTETQEVDQLLMFDPANSAMSLKKHILDGNKRWHRQLFRNKESFKKTEYQILYVVSGLMDDAEYERSKVLIGDSEFSKIRTRL